MKTKIQKNSDSRLQNRTAQQAEKKQPKIDFAKRQLNRKLPTGEVLNLLEREAPLLCRIAQIVGRWIWIQFPERQSRDITSILSQAGFHWSPRRQAWQHPCGNFCDVAATYDPRTRYGSRPAV